MLIDELKTRMNQAFRERDEVVRNILALAVAEIRANEARQNRELSEEEQQGQVRKLLKANEETLGLTGSDDPRSAHLKREIAVLQTFLPTAMSADAIAASLAPVADALRAAKNDGQAMGIAMKHLKGSGAVVEAADVQQAVKQVRGG
jgi:uncharacterized protein YqeY